MQELSNLVVKYCIDKFEEISVPLRKYKPTEEMYYKLYTKNRNLVTDFSNQNEIEKMDPLEKISLISKVLQDNFDKEYEKVKELLVIIAALYGKSIMDVIGGKWSWSKAYKNCLIKDLSGPFVSYDVLNMVEYTWEKKKINEIINDYTEICTNYLNWVAACEKVRNK